METIRNEDTFGSIDLIVNLNAEAYGLSCGIEDDLYAVTTNNWHNTLLGNDYKRWYKKDIATAYSFKYFAENIIRGNPKTFEVIGAPIESFKKLSKVGNMLVANKDKFLSKRLVDAYKNLFLSYNLELVRMVDMPKEFGTQINTHMMKIVRSYLTALDIAEGNGLNIKRNLEKSLLESIANGEYTGTDLKPKDSYFSILDQLQKDFSYASQNTSLPETCTEVELLDEIIIESNSVFLGLNKKPLIDL